MSRNVDDAVVLPYLQVLEARVALPVSVDVDGAFVIVDDDLPDFTTDPELTTLNGHDHSHIVWVDFLMVLAVVDVLMDVDPAIKGLDDKVKGSVVDVVVQIVGILRIVGVSQTGEPILVPVGIGILDLLSGRDGQVLQGRESLGHARSESHLF